MLYIAIITVRIFWYLDASQVPERIQKHWKAPCGMPKTTLRRGSLTRPLIIKEPKFETPPLITSFTKTKMIKSQIWGSIRHSQTWTHLIVRFSTPVSASLARPISKAFSSKLKPLVYRILSGSFQRRRRPNRTVIPPQMMKMDFQTLKPSTWPMAKLRSPPSMRPIPLQL